MRARRSRFDRRENDTLHAQRTAEGRAASPSARRLFALALASLAAAALAGASSCAASDDVETTLSSTSGSGEGGSGGAGGAGGSTACEPGAEEACYEGPEGTAGIGICVAGKRTCAPDGSGFGACEGQVVPVPADDGETPEDEDCTGSAAACPGDVLWGEAFGDVADQRALAIAVDGAGNTLVTGSFAGTMMIGGETLSSSGGLDIFVVKLDPSGAPV